MPMPFFEHFILPEGSIRLLTVYGTEDQISCSLTRHDFAKCPAYYALSYAWGPPPPEHQIIVNGRKFKIRENLYECLASLLRVPHEPAEEEASDEDDVPRSEPVVWGKAPPTGKQDQKHAVISSSEKKGNNKKRVKPGVRHFWIDQLCIDQTNIPERNKQVAIMDQTYSRAKETLVWVGPNKSASTELHIPHQVLDYDEPLCTDMYRIFANPYWTRLWIVQEVLLSKAITVRHGDESFNWDLFEELASELVRILGHGDDQRLDRHQDTILWRRQGLFKGLPESAACLLYDRWSDVGLLELNGGRKLSDLLQRFAGQNCEMAVDKVYGLQGLITDRARIEIDYEISAEELFYKVVDKLADVEGDELFEDEQLDVCLALREQMGIELTVSSSERMARIVFGYVKRRLDNVGQTLSAEEEENGLGWYLRYLSNPGPTHIPSQYRVNDPARGTYKEFMAEQALSLAVTRAKFRRFMEDTEGSMDKKRVIGKK